MNIWSVRGLGAQARLQRMKRMAPLCLLLLAACGEPLPPDVVELTYATPYAASHPFSLADQVWMDFVEQRSNGTLQVKPSWAGALLSSEHSMLELRHGVADIGLITPIYVKGGTHLIRIQSGFYAGAETVEQQLALYRCLEAASPQYATELEGLKVLAIQGGALPGIVTTNKPIHALADLQGMRIRAPTELLGVLQALGADPVNMPMGEVYSALAKGVLDGVIAPHDTFRALHFAEVADYYVEMKIPRGAYPGRAMRSTRWDELSAAHRQVLEESIAVWEQALMEKNAQAQDDGLEVARMEGITFTTLTAADEERFSAIYLEQAERNAEALARYGIDGSSVFTNSRRSINADGTVTCARGKP
jgi:TRAP-type C4-dicarboxylate transport system substrate-binding protein